MAKYIDADLLRKEIEKHIKEVKDAAKKFTPNMGFFDAKLPGIYDVMAILDSLQQEQPSEDLEGAVEKCIDRALLKWSYDDEDGIEQYIDDAFKEGAFWQKEQMLKDAVDGEISSDGAGRLYAETSLYLEDEMALNEGDKVKIIIVKEDKK